MTAPPVLPNRHSGPIPIVVGCDVDLLAHIPACLTVARIWYIELVGRGRGSRQRACLMIHVPI